MTQHPYERFRQNDLILRDELAIDRTLLANERTLLAYFRSALTLILAGVTFLHFIEAGLLRVIGYAFVPLGIVVAILGWMRYRRMDAGIRIVRDSLDRHEAARPGAASAAGQP